MAFALNLRKPLPASPDRRRGERRPAHDAGGERGRRPGLRSAGVGVAAGADANVDGGAQHAGESAADRPPADRPAVPRPRHPAGDVPRVRGAHHVVRRQDGGAGRGVHGDGHRDADALAAAVQQFHAGAAGPAGRLRGGEGHPRALQGGPRRAAARRHRQGRHARRRCRTTRSTCCCRASRRGGTASIRASSSCSTISSA